MDSCKPGDRVSLVGIYKAVPPRAQGTISGTFRSVLLANSVRLLSRDAGQLWSCAQAAFKGRLLSQHCGSSMNAQRYLRLEDVFTFCMRPKRTRHVANLITMESLLYWGAISI